MPDTLIDDLSALAHGPRQRRMVDLGRVSVSGGAEGRRAAGALDRLGEGDGYRRRLALAAAWGSRDPAVALRGLADPSRATRALARPLAAALCDEAALVAALDAAPPRDRKTLLVHLRRRSRGAAIDAFLGALMARADPALGIYPGGGFEHGTGGGLGSEVLGLVPRQRA